MGSDTEWLHWRQVEKGELTEAVTSSTLPFLGAIFAFALERIGFAALKD